MNQNISYPKFLLLWCDPLKLSRIYNDVSDHWKLWRIFIKELEILVRSSHSQVRHELCYFYEEFGERCALVHPASGTILLLYDFSSKSV